MIPDKDMGDLYELSNCEILKLEVDDEHYYYGGVLGQTKEYYVGVTTVIDIGGPFPEGLRQYLRVTSFEEQKNRLEVTGARGKHLHDALDRLMRREELLMTEYPTTYEKDAIVTFMQMVRFLDPTAYHTELIVADPDLRMAGTMDFNGVVDEWRLVCLMDPNKYLEVDSDGDFQLQERWLGGPLLKLSRRIRIVIDWKFTGRNAYSHKIQVAAYKTMNNKSQPGMRVTRAFTWRYNPNKKTFRFDFQESTYSYLSFKRVYATFIEYSGEFPQPPVIRKYPERVRLYEPKEVE